jgi:hypothetical protein
MKERPILFSGPMVRAILDGSKTQTRRVVKPVRRYEHNNICRPDLVEDPYAVWWHGVSENVGCFQICPHGAPGDRLWVRETFAMNKAKAGPPVVYRADHGEAQSVFVERPHSAEWDVVVTRWRPSIFMPRAASRILLEITDVRVQRLQEISEADARAEGVTPNAFEQTSDNWGGVLYRRLWEQINGPGSWDANPWVWAITFQMLEP